MCQTPLVKEFLSEPDATCDTCGVELQRGEPVLLRIETGEVYCSRRCANIAHQFERELKRRRGLVTTGG